MGLVLFVVFFLCDEQLHILSPTVQKFSSLSSELFGTKRIKLVLMVMAQILEQLGSLIFWMETSPEALIGK